MDFARREFIKSSGIAGLGVAAASVVKGANPAGNEITRESRAKWPTVGEEIRAAIMAAPLSLQFRGATPQELSDWQARFAEKLAQIVGPTAPPPKWTAVTLSTATFPDHIREELLLSASGMPSLPLYVLRPISAKPKRFPIVLCLHGHGLGGNDMIVGRAETPELVEEIQRYNGDYGRQLVRQGYLIVAPCFTPFGRRLDEKMRNTKDATAACSFEFIRLMFLGRTLIGENTRDARWALEYAAGRSDARPDRIGCVGFSLGGRMTMLVAALDPRIRVAVISGALNMFQERVQRETFSDGPQVIPGLLNYGDTPEIGSLIAPRPAIWETGSDDKLIVPGWKEEAMSRLQRAYAAAGRPDALQFYTFKGQHSWNGATAVPLLARELQAD